MFHNKYFSRVKYFFHFFSHPTLLSANELDLFAYFAKKKKRQKKTESSRKFHRVEKLK